MKIELLTTNFFITISYNENQFTITNIVFLTGWPSTFKKNRSNFQLCIVRIERQEKK